MKFKHTEHSVLHVSPPKKKHVGRADTIAIVREHARFVALVGRRDGSGGCT